jgi:hypothetical protein
MADERASARELAGATAFFSALAAVSFARVWPVASTHAVAAAVYDFGPNLWAQWWGPFALSKAMNPLVTRWLYFPAGSSMGVDAWVLQWLLLWPLSAFLGPLARGTALAALSYAATGAAAYALFRLYSRSRAGCLLAAAAVSFSAFRLYSLTAGQTELLQTQWAALLLLAFAAAARARFSPRSCAWLAAAAVAAAYNEQRTFLMTALACALFALGLALFHREPLRVPRRHGLAAGLALALCGAALLPLAAVELPVLGPAFVGYGHRPETLRVGPADLVTPPSRHALRALGVLPPRRGLPESEEGYLDAAFLALAAAGLWARRRGREERAWAVTLAGLAVLESSRLPLVRVPVLTWLHVPARFSLLTSLAAGLFAAAGWESLAPRLGRAAPAVFAALLAVFVLENNPLFVAPVRVWDEREPALEALRTSEGAVLDLPLPVYALDGRAINGRIFLRAARHERPVFAGHLTAPSSGAEGQPDALAPLLACQRGGSCAGVEDALRRLASLGARWVITDAELPADPLRAAVERSKSLRLEARTSGYALYSLDQGR